MDRINDIMVNGWDEKLKNHNPKFINYLVQQNMHFLNRWVEKILLEGETEYSKEELINFGYIALVSIITEGEQLNQDLGETQDQLIDFFEKLILSEQENVDVLSIPDCESQDCLGKECEFKYCNKLFSKNNLSQEAELHQLNKYLLFLEKENETDEKEKIYYLDLSKQNKTK